MFGYNALIENIKSGKAARIAVDGVEYRLSEAAEFQKKDNGCTGIINDSLRFTLDIKEIETGTILSFSFSAVNGKQVRVGDITLLDFAEQTEKCSPDRAVFCFQDSLFDQYVRKASDNDGQHQTKPMCLVYDLKQKESFFAAQLTFDKNLFEFDLTCGG